MLVRTSCDRFLLLLLVAAAVLGGCSRKAPVVGPEPIRPDEVRVEGNRVDWVTSGGARGSVRYGFTRPTGTPPQFSFDHMAYPDAHGRLDRAFLTEHSVALLDLRPGNTVYYQTVSEAPGAAPVYSAPDSFVATIGHPQGLLTSTMIHIGFGDSHLITMPTTGKRFLIDCGYGAATQSVRDYLQEHGISSVSTMLSTHVHADHLGGFVGPDTLDTTDGILPAYPPLVFFDSPLKSSDSRKKPAYHDFFRTLPGPTRLLVLQRGDSSHNVPDLALDPEVAILCLNSGIPPGYVPVGYEGTNINNESIVLLFGYGDVQFVIGGDAEEACEGIILQGWPASELEVEYFKALHHGLSDANAAAFVNTLKPRVAFIPNTRQVWDPPNEFQGAIASTTSKLEGIGSHIYVIDEARPLGKTRPPVTAGNGFQYNVTFATDGRSYEVRLEVATQTVPKVTAQSFACVQHALHPESEFAPAAATIDGENP